MDYISEALRWHRWLEKHRFLDRVPDKLYLKEFFFCRMGKRLDLKHPKTFNEKLQWLKLYDRKPAYTVMVDKYEAKQYVAEQIGDEYIIPVVGGPWESVEEIDFNKLPSNFVLKCTHDSGGLVVCKNKNMLDVEAVKTVLNHSMNNDYYLHGREWPYKNVPRKIFAEKYMEDQNGQMIDYKFYCFNGKPAFLYVSKGMENHRTAQVSFVTLDWKMADFGRSDYAPLDVLPPKPRKFDEMIDIAKKLSKSIPFLRVDLYEIDGKIYFGELTFSPCGGFMPFEPRNADEEVGKLLDLPYTI